MKKIGITFISIIYIIYFIGLFYANKISGDILSPVVTLVAFFVVFWGFYYREDNPLFKITGGLFASAIFVWFLCDFMWGISTLLLQVDPNNNMVIVYGYSVTNLFFLIGTFIFGIFTLKNKNRMQIFLDILITAACLGVLIWVFVFDQNVEKASVLKSDVVSMLSLMSDVLIFAWINIWFFSVLGKKVALSLKFLGSGILLFVIIDFVYYYQYFYMTYQPNSFLDGGYVISFALIALGGYVRGKRIASISYHKLEKQLSEEIIKSKFRNKMIVLLIPVLLLIIGGAGMEYLLVIITSIMFYLLFTNYIQTNIFRDELLQKEKEHVLDLEEKVEARTKEILRIMYTDIVTGLNNRRYFEEFLNKQCSEIGKHEKILLLFIDQNKYKGIKGTYGKEIAENLLKQVGNRIQSIAIEEEGTLSAYGEDVFVLLLRGQEIYEKGIEVGNKIIYSCSDAYHVGEQDIVVTLNIGIACYPVDSKNPEDLTKNADTAMMQAKELGINKILTYTEQIGNFVYNRNKIEIKLKKVVFDEEFRLYYQKQVYCDTGKTFGFEALLRWKTKSGTFISPLDFIPITEETGMIVPLGYWIMEKAVSQLAEWNRMDGEYKMAINVSVRQLADRDFVMRLQSILEKYHMRPELIEIEITENVQLEENIEMGETLLKISDMGVSIAIDDFGTGYSSLYYLKNLPVNRIKIAKELIDNIERDTYDHSIVKTVISIAKARKIKVIAEGVETKEQWDCLRKLHCDEIQGYYFAKPLPPEEVF